MTKKLVTNFVCFITLLSLVACSSQPEYIEAKSTPLIELPPDVDQERLGQIYVVPPSLGKAEQLPVPFPPTVSVESTQQAASLQSTTSQQLWILNNQSVSSTWSQLLRFWQQRNVVLVQRDTLTAMMETAWFSQAAQPGYEVRYRIRLEKGLQADSTEIYLSNEKRNLRSESSEKLTDATHVRWLSNQLVRALNQQLTDVGDTLLATSITLPDKMRFSADREMLMVNADAERLYYSLQRGLNKNGLTIYDESFDKDQPLAIFYIDEYEANKRTRKHWWNPFSFKQSDEPKLSAYTLQEILAAADDDFARIVGFESQKTRRLPKVSGYLLVMQSSPVDDEYQLVIRDVHGKMLSRSENQRLLDVVRRRLY